MTTYPAFRTGYRSAPAPAVSDAAPTARPGEVATLGDGRRRVGASGPRDATAAVSVPQPGVAEHRAEVRPSHSHAVGKRSAGGGSGGDSLLGLTAGTAALDGVLEPDGDLVMVVDTHNTAHVLLPKGERRITRMTLCGHQLEGMASLYSLLDTLSAPWSLLTNRQYRAWPPWPCQTCTLAALPGARPVQAGNQGHGDTGSGTAATGHTAG